VTSDYQRFTSAVLEASASYARDGDPAHLREIAAQLATLPSGDDVPAAELRWSIVGWTARGGLVTASALSRANPDWTIRLRRAPRPDVSSSRWRRVGFRLSATGSAAAAPFRFVLARGALATPSNADVRTQMHQLGWPINGEGTPTVYIDDVTRSPVVDDRPGRWIDGLVNRWPAALWRFADAPEGVAWRERLARGIDDGSSTHWSDRFRLTLGTRSLEPRSDLRALRVTRPIPHDPSPVDGLEIPLLQRDGDVVEPVGSGRMAPAPGRDWLAIDHAWIQGGGTVWSDSELICYELAADPANDSVAGQWEYLFGSMANRSLSLLQKSAESPASIPEAILIGGRADENWYHWLVDYLARVLEIPDGIAADVPVLVSSRVPRSGLQALRELTERPILMRNPSLTTRVDRLHVAAPVVQLLDDPRVPWADGFALRAPALRRLRERWGVAGSASPDGRRVFLSRQSGIRRGVLNEPELVDVARSAGLEILDPARLGFAEQRAMFQEAALVVGGSGAVMANYLFLRPGAEVIALTSRQLWDFVMPAALAEVAGARFRYLTGPSSSTLSEARNRSEWIHAPFSVEPELLERTLAELPSLRA